MKYLHTMVRVSDVEASLQFYCDGLGLREVRRTENEQGRFTLIFLAAPEDMASASQINSPLLELTYNWDTESYNGGRNFGHLAFSVQNIYETCHHLESIGIEILRPLEMGVWRLLRVRTEFRLSCCNMGLRLSQKSLG